MFRSSTRKPRRIGSSRPRFFRRGDYRNALRHELLESRHLLAGVTVDTTVDSSDGDTSSIAALLLDKGADGQISLREAILAANSTVGPDTIDFDTLGVFATPQTITLGGTELPIITDALVITGPTANLTIDANQKSRIFVIDDGINANQVPVEIVSLTLTGGMATGAVPGNGGGAILSRESLTLRDSAVTGNSADNGGGIYSISYPGGTTTIESSVLSGNSANETGGGIRSVNFGGTTTILNSTLSGNSANDGGGIHSINSGGTITIENSTLSGNSATGNGGGIYLLNLGGTTTFENSTLSENSANDGGGIYARTDSVGRTRIKHSTLSENSANLSGGGIYSRTNGAGMTTITSSIAAGNTAATGPDLYTNTATTVTFTLIGDNSGSGLTEAQAPDVNGNLVGQPAATGGAGVINPLLGSLTDNGGPTLTMALMAGSPAIDVGDPNAMAGTNGIPSFDQRGTPYDRVLDGDGDGTPRIDMGAYERFKTITISGHKWEDINGDGTWDAGEPGLAGWTIELDSNGDGVADATTMTSDGSTDANGDGLTDVMDVGYYQFADLAPGSYAISEQQQPGWTNTYDGSVTVIAESGVDQGGLFESTEPLNFGNFQNITISGYKWDDVNGNGTWDAGEPGLAGWTIELDSNGDGVADATTMTSDGSTDANGDGLIDVMDVGYYQFADLAPGSYAISEQQQAGWTNTYDGGVTVNAESGVDQGGLFKSTEPLNFGNFQNITISGYKWEDVNGNGTWDAGEPGLADWTIELDSNGDGVVDATTMTSDGSTDANGDGLIDVMDVGYYQFADLAPGSYAISEQQQAGWTNTYDGGVTVIAESGVDQAGLFESTEPLNFGNFQNITISGYKWEDVNGNGTWDAGEPGLADWTIELDSNGDGVADATTMTADGSTDANGDGLIDVMDVGYYQFADLAPGSYAISEQQQPGWTNTYDGGVTVIAESGVDQAGLFKSTEPLNFGNFQNITISGYKWEDVNGNGTWDAGEPGLAGWTIELDSNGDGVADATTMTSDGSTDANGDGLIDVMDVGYYQFADLAPGSYAISEQQQPGWTNTYDGGVTVIAESGVDQAGLFESTEPLNFGNFQNITISGYKWEDINGNGMWDAGEPGLADWTIELDSNGDGVVDATTMTSDGSTDANGDGLIDVMDVGYYQFADLAPGSYAISEQQQPGWTNTYDGGVTVIAESGVDQAGLFESTEPLNFGNFQNITISGYKWDDVNGNGTWDAGEPGLADWTIELDSNGDGVADATTMTADGSTDANGDGLIDVMDVGYYQFADLAPGSYAISEQQQPGWTNTYDGGVTVIAESGVDQAGLFESTEPLNFGNFQNITISGYKWEDINGNGMWDAGEPGLADWTIELDSNGDGVVDATTMTSDGSTDANGDGLIDVMDVGYYQFADLGPGSYRVTERMRDGWSNTYNGSTTAIALSGGDRAGRFETTELLNFGNRSTIVVSGIKFEDLNKNAVRDAGEPVIAGWQVRAYADNGNGFLEQAEFDAGFVAAALTDASGVYTLDLEPGDYVIVEVMFAGWAQSAPLRPVLALNLNTGGVPLGPGGHAVTVVPGQSQRDQDFGNYQTVCSTNQCCSCFPATVSGVKFLDQNGNGIQDGDDAPISGWTIWAYMDADGNGLLNQTEFNAGPVTAITSASGTYTFALNPGNYIIVENLRGDGNTSFLQTFPNRNVLDPTLDTGTMTLGSFGYALALRSGQISQGNDFGNMPRDAFDGVNISGFKWEDMDGDGVWDASETGYDGWTIILGVDTNGDGVADRIEATTTTSDGGAYRFENLDPLAAGETYVVREAQTNIDSGEWTQTFGSAGYVVAGTSGNSLAGTFGVAEPGNFGNFHNVDISGYKWQDTDGDGIWDVGEPGLVNWIIELDSNGDGVADTTATTDANGRYQFTNLGPGNYRVTEQMRTGWSNTYDGSATVTAVSGVDRAGRSETTELLNFGNRSTISVTGIKFEDLNKNAVRDADEPVIVGWQIRAYADNGNGFLEQNELDAGFVAAVLTDASGVYALDLEPGNYVIVEVLWSGWAQSAPLRPVLALNLNTGGVPLGPGGHAVTVIAGQSQTNKDFGNFQSVCANPNCCPFVQATVSGVKFQDQNANGIQDGEDALVSGWTIWAYVDTDGNGLLNQTEFNAGPITAVTDASGTYTFTLNPGNYIIVEDITGDANTSFLQTFPNRNVLDPNLNTGTANLGSFGYVLSLTSGQISQGNNFGNSPRDEFPPTGSLQTKRLFLASTFQTPTAAPTIVVATPSAAAGASVSTSLPDWVMTGATQAMTNFVNGTSLDSPVQSTGASVTSTRTTFSRRSLLASSWGGDRFGAAVADLMQAHDAASSTAFASAPVIVVTSAPLPSSIDVDALMAESDDQDAASDSHLLGQPAKSNQAEERVELTASAELASQTANPNVEEDTVVRFRVDPNAFADSTATRPEEASLALPTPKSIPALSDESNADDGVIRFRVDRGAFAPVVTPVANPARLETTAAAVVTPQSAVAYAAANRSPVTATNLESAAVLSSRQAAAAPYWSTPDQPYSGIMSRLRRVGMLSAVEDSNSDLRDRTISEIFGSDL